MHETMKNLWHVFLCSAKNCRIFSRCFPPPSVGKSIFLFLFATKWKERREEKKKMIEKPTIQMSKKMRDNKTSLSVRVFLMLWTHSNNWILWKENVSEEKKNGRKSTMNRNIFSLTKKSLNAILMHPLPCAIPIKCSATISSRRLYLFDVSPV